VPEEVHRWPHANVHLVEMHEDRHQGNGVWRQMLLLESIRLQQHEGGEWQYEPSKGVSREVHELTGPDVGERDDPTKDLVLISGRLLVDRLPQLPEVFGHSKARG
jgi:hypothetical protein